MRKTEWWISWAFEVMFKAIYAVISFKYRGKKIFNDY